MLYQLIDFLTLILPTGVGIASAFVGIKMAQGENHKKWWQITLAAGVLTSVLTWISQNHLNKEHLKEISEQKRATQRLQTILAVIRLDAQILASRDAVLPKVWACLPSGDEYVSVRTEIADDHPAPKRNRCPSKVPTPPVLVAVALCKTTETCHAVHAPDLVADFANGKEDCVRAIDDRATSRLRVEISCKIPTDVRPYLTAMSISDLRTGSLRIQIEAGTSSEFPNPRLLNSAVLESATVTLNGIEINLKTKDFERQPVGNSFIHVYDLKPKDLSAID